MSALQAHQASTVPRRGLDLAVSSLAPDATALPVDPGAEVPLPRALRLRASFIGLGLGAFGLIAATAGGLAIATGPFHTALGSIV